MRRILIILLSMLSFGATAQTVQTIGSPGTRVNSRGDFISDSILYLPRTQVTSRTPFQSGAIRYQASDSSIYQWTGTAWRKISGTVDSLLFSTRAWRQKGDDSLAAIINTRTDTVNLLSTKAWRQKGIDSVAALSRVGGSGTTNYVSKFTGTSTLGNSQIFDNGTNVGIGTITPSQKLDIVGNTITRGYAEVYNGTHAVRYQMPMASGTTGLNTFISNASGASLTGSGNDASYNVIVGHSAGTSLTTGAFNTAVGTPSLQATTTGIANVAIGSFAGYSITTGSVNTGVGSAAIGAVTTASNNTAVGREALGTLVTGANNVGIGWRAGHFRSTSQSNSKTNNSIFIGYDTRSSADSVNNVIAIGTSVIDNGSNTTTLGNSSTIGTYIPAGESYFGTTSDAGDFRVQVNGRHYIESPAYTNSSDLGLVINTASGAGAGLNLRHASNGRFSIVQNFNANNTTSILVGTSTNNPTTTALYFDHSNGNVGVRGAVANYSLTVNGTNQQTAIQLIQGSATGNTSTDGFIIGTETVGSDTAAAILKNRENYPIILYTNNTDRGRLSAAGELWLGYTADQGSYILQANGSGYFSGSLTTGAPTGGTAQPWKLGTVATVSPTSPNRTIEVEVNGTIYYLHAKTTND